MNLYATRNNGRLFLAVDQWYQGSINYYENKLAKWFMSLFRKTITETIGEKTYCLNKKSYQKFLAKFSIIQQQTKSPLRQVVVNHTQETYMRDSITAEKADKLFLKLIKDLYANDLEKAKKHLGKGANINLHFFKVGDKDSVISRQQQVPYQEMSDYMRPTAWPIQDWDSEYVFGSTYSLARNQAFEKDDDPQLLDFAQKIADFGKLPISDNPPQQIFCNGKFTRKFKDITTRQETISPPPTVFFPIFTQLNQSRATIYTAQYEHIFSRNRLTTFKSASKIETETLRKSITIAGQVQRIDIH